MILFDQTKSRTQWIDLIEFDQLIADLDCTSSKMSQKTKFLTGSN